jgi:TPR repeat protein
LLDMPNARFMAGQMFRGRGSRPAVRQPPGVGHEVPTTTSIGKEPTATINPLLEAARLFRQAADAGHVEAQYALATMLRRGEGGLARQPEEALRLLRRAAAAGHCPALYKLGVACYFGRGGEPKDQAKASRLFKRAADQNFPPAAYCLGVMIDRGEGGVRQDHSVVFWLYNKACERGHPQGAYNLAYWLARKPSTSRQPARRRLVQGPTGMEEEGTQEEEVARLYGLAAGMGHAKACYNLARMRERGVGVASRQQGREEAVALFRRAVVLGSSKAAGRLRRMGEAVQDPAE